MDEQSTRELVNMARLRLSADQEERVRAHVQRLLDHFAELAAVPTDDVEASPYPMNLNLRSRVDEPDTPLGQEATLINAPASRAGCFLVPRVVEG